MLLFGLLGCGTPPGGEPEEEKEPRRKRESAIITPGVTSALVRLFEHHQVPVPPVLLLQQ